MHSAKFSGLIVWIHSRRSGRISRRPFANARPTRSASSCWPCSTNGCVGLRAAKQTQPLSVMACSSGVSRAVLLVQ
eukprot:scaffold124721_cov66-Phaeocystis_antarctica.AAC.4